MTARRTALLLAAAAAIPSASGAASLSEATAAAAPRHCLGADRPAASTPARALRAAVVCLINVERRERGLPPLRVSPRLNRSATSWTAHLVRSDSFTHGQDFAARISAVGFRWAAAGENIATGFETPRAVVRGWMASQGHCQNILDPQFASVGTGVVARGTGGSRWGATWTQDFGLLEGHRAPSGNWGPASRCPY